MLQASDLIDVAPLRSALDGPAIGPRDEGFDAARQAWNLATEQRPAAVVYAEHPEDVAATVLFARERGLRVSAQGTGHGAAAMGTLDDTILLKTLRLGGVEIYPEARRARAEAGALWGDVVVPAGQHGLVALHGSSATVGVVGFTLGGGLGWLGRLHGLAANSVLAIELVTADGELRRVDHDHEPELFWALRGGGGAFGVVTAIEFSLYPLAEAYAGMLAWPAELGPEVLAAYSDWTRTLPEEMTAKFRYLTLPPLPEVPEPLRGRPVVDVTASFAGDPVEGAELMRPLRELAPPLVDTYGTIPAAELRGLNQDPEEPLPVTGDGGLLSSLPAEAVDALVEVSGPSAGSPLLMLQLRHLGGALSRAPEDAGALARLDGEFAYYGVGVPIDPEAGGAIRAHLERVRSALSPWAGPRYLNFADEPSDTADAFSEDGYARLARAKAEYDPQDLFRSNHPIAPEGQG